MYGREVSLNKLPFLQMSKKDAEDDIITRVETLADATTVATAVVDDQVEEDLPDEYELYIQEKEQLDEEYDFLQVIKTLAFT